VPATQQPSAIVYGGYLEYAPPQSALVHSLGKETRRVLNTNDILYFEWNKAFKVETANELLV